MGRLWRIVKGWWLRLLGKAEQSSPRAILEAEIADFHKATASFNENLAKQAGMIERLKAQIHSEGKKVELLTARASASYAAKNMEKAGSLALQLKEIKRETTENQSQMKQADDLYKNLVKQRDAYTKEARVRIEKIKGKISKAEMAEAQAKLTEAISATNFNPDGRGLGELEESLDSRIADASGKVRVASETASIDTDFDMTAGEEKAMEEMALAEFAQQMGFAAAAAPPIDAPAAAERELGPADPLAPKVEG
ncbi:MAG: phage shock protein A [Myxococcota bacterium]|jgi:phage shock protein A